MALPAKLFKTSITIWTEVPTDGWELDTLAREAIDGEGYCDFIDCTEITDASQFPDTEFFGVDGDPDDRPKQCQNPQCLSLGVTWSHTHPVGKPDEAVWAWVCDTCGCVQERRMFAVIHKATGKIVEETGAPFDAYSSEEVEEEFAHPHRKGADLSAKTVLEGLGIEVVPLTDELEAQYRDLEPDDA